VTDEQPSPADNPAPSPVQEVPAAQEPWSSRKTAFLHPNVEPMFSIQNVLWVTFFLVLTAATRCANYRNVFVTNGQGVLEQVFFVDGDCYARMTRVREILEGWGIIHYHAWENYPLGTWPHTTAPFDYLIVGLALLLKPFTANYIDMAGAIVSPILGVLITAFLALWARELNQRYRKLMLLLASLSPILVHGGSLGRPDHQSLQMFLAAVGMGAELIMVRAPCVSWSIVSGAAWGLGLWVSLYEPLVLMVVILVTKLIFYRSNLFVKERWWGLAVLAGILGLAYALEGKYLVKSFMIEAQDQTLRTYFGNWSATIGEMSQVGIFSELLYRWVGFGLLFSPLLLIARLRDTKRSLLLLSLLVVTFALTLEEVRWGYFFALVYTMSLPWQLSLFKRRWLVYTLYLLSLWPVAWDWHERLFPDELHDLERVLRLNDQRRLRQAADFIREKAPGCILAPWWWSPALVYWSQQPAVAGSSHESLAGIVDTSRFFSTTDPKLAEAICNQRYVETVVTGNPENIVVESVHVLGQPLPQRENTMADILWDRPHSAPLFLHLVFDNNVIKVFEVNHGSITYR
jgi:hypothetical protein